MRGFLLAASAVAALASSYGTASAQRVGVEVYSQPRYDRYYDRGEFEFRRGPRVYGYYQDDERIVEPGVIVRPSNCGQFRYWDGTRCADARVNPPNLN